ncbi:hypothetical protein M432DRAFT_592140 [Thermoascus aurantiacus ATCC 26904]
MCDTCTAALLARELRDALTQNRKAVRTPSNTNIASITLRKKKEKDRCDDGEQRLLKKGVAELAFLRMAEILRAHSARQETSPLLANQGNDSTAIVIQKSVQSAVETEIVGENAKASASQHFFFVHKPTTGPAHRTVHYLPLSRWAARLDRSRSRLLIHVGICTEREYLMSRLVDKWKSHPWTPADAVHAWLESEIVTRSLGWYRACDEQPGSSI